MPIYMKIEGVEGESTQKGYEKWIEIQSWSWGVSNPGASPNFQSLSFTFDETKPTPDLFLACCKGNHIPQAVLKTKGDTREYMQVTLKEVFISSVSISGHTGGSGAPDTQVTLGFEYVDIRSYFEKPDRTIGTTHHWWDLKNNTGG